MAAAQPSPRKKGGLRPPPPEACLHPHPTHRPLPGPQAPGASGPGLGPQYSPARHLQASLTVGGCQAAAKAPRPAAESREGPECPGLQVYGRLGEGWEGGPPRCCQRNPSSRVESTGQAPPPGRLLEAWGTRARCQGPHLRERPAWAEAHTWGTAPQPRPQPATALLPHPGSGSSNQGA